MAEHLSENWPDLLEPGIRSISTGEETRFSKKDSMLGEIFNMGKSGKSYEKFSSASALDDWETFTGTVGYDDTFQGYDTKIEFPEFVKGIKIERKLRDDDLYGIIKQRAEELGYSLARTREKHGAQIFNEAFTTEPSADSNYVTGNDGCELCASDHPFPNGSGNTQSNEGTTALSATAVEATRKLMVAFKGDNEEVINISPDMLLVPIDLEETAFEIINSKGKINTSDNNVNFHNGKYKLAVWPNFLTDSNNWFMVDQKLMKKYLLWFDRIAMEVNQDSDSDTLVAKYVGYCRYWRFWINWRFIYGQLVS